MYRHTNLFTKICEIENIKLAHHKAQLGKSHREAIKKFNKDLDTNLLEIQDMLVNRTFTTSEYKTKVIYEPKERQIYILPFAPDRIVQHALMNILEPIWTKLFIKDSYSCIKFRGIHKGSIRTSEFVRRNKYCIQFDISKFYPSMRHDIMKKIIRQKIKCPSTLWLLDDIIDSFPGEVNLPIGNLTSQWFGNLYMNELDTYVKHDLRIKDYIRYCGDFLVFENDKKILKDFGNKIEGFLKDELALVLSRKDLYQTSRGVDFLGYRHFGTHVLLRKSTAKHMQRVLKATDPDTEHGKQVIASYKGWTRWANCHNLVSKISL